MPVIAASKEMASVTYVYTINASRPRTMHSAEEAGEIEYYRPHAHLTNTQLNR